MSNRDFSQSRIAKNTLFLYLRMFLTMGITLYSSRLVLDILGIQDFGIYSVVGGFIVLLSIIGNSTTAATQRFITYELGRGSKIRIIQTFSMGLIAHFIICLVLFIIGETIGLWYILNELNIPVGREDSTLYVFQLSLLTACVNLIRAPYNALIIAYEKMAFFAYLSILEAVIKLAIIGVLFLVPFNKLFAYSLLVLLSNILIFICYRSYCKHAFATCTFSWDINWNRFKELFTYLGWNLVGASAGLGSRQVGNLMVNKYFGVSVNAAYSIAMQVNGALNQFVANFQTAFTPQLVKLIAANKKDHFWELSKTSALLSYYLLFIIVFPIFTNIDYILHLWLKDVPEYSNIFCQLLIIYSLIDAIQAPLWIGISATGDIKIYEIWLSSLLILNIPLSILILHFGAPPYWVFIVQVLLNVISAVIRCIHVKIQLNYPISKYFKQVIVPAVAVSIISIFCWMVLCQFLSYDSFFEFCLLSAVIILIIIIIIYSIGIGQTEKVALKGYLKNKLS